MLVQQNIRFHQQKRKQMCKTQEHNFSDRDKLTMEIYYLLLKLLCTSPLKWLTVKMISIQNVSDFSKCDKVSKINLTEIFTKNYYHHKSKFNSTQS